VIVRRLGSLIVRRRWTSLARQCIAATFFVALVFSMVTLNASFNRVFYEAQQNTGGGQTVVITDHGIRFFAPTDKWVWNSSQLVLDQGTVKLMQPLRDGFAAMTIVLGIMLFSRESTESYKEAKRDNEQFRVWTGTLYAIGVRREDIFGIFLMEKVFACLAGLVMGTVLSITLLIPYVLAEFAGSGMNLFFRNISDTYLIGALAAGMFVSLSVTIKVNTLRMGTVPKTLLKFRKD